jgi:hypothetical protein
MQQRGEDLGKNCKSPATSRRCRSFGAGEGGAVAPPGEKVGTVRGHAGGSCACGAERCKTVGDPSRRTRSLAPPRMAQSTLSSPVTCSHRASDRDWLLEYGTGSGGDRWFESISLQQRVSCEPDSRRNLARACRTVHRDAYDRDAQQRVPEFAMRRSQYQRLSSQTSSKREPL